MQRMKPSTFRSAFWPVLWGEWVPAVPEMPVSGCGAHTTPPALSSVLSTPAVQTFACQVSCTTPSNYSLNCPACARPVPIGIQCLQSSSRPSLPLALRLETESNCPRLPSTLSSAAPEPTELPVLRLTAFGLPGCIQLSSLSDSLHDIACLYLETQEMSRVAPHETNSPPSSVINFLTISIS